MTAIFCQNLSKLIILTIVILADSIIIATKSSGLLLLQNTELSVPWFLVECSGVKFQPIFSAKTNVCIAETNRIEQRLHSVVDWELHLLSLSGYTCLLVDGVRSIFDSLLIELYPYVICFNLKLFFKQNVLCIHWKG